MNVRIFNVAGLVNCIVSYWLSYWPKGEIMCIDDRPFFKKWFYKIRAKWRAWNYKRKYGINIEDGILEYGKHVLLTEEKDA